MNLNWKISEKEGKNVSEKKEHIFENKQLLKSTTSLHLFLHQNDEKVGFGAEWLVGIGGTVLGSKVADSAARRTWRERREKQTSRKKRKTKNFMIEKRQYENMKNEKT